MPNPPAGQLTAPATATGAATDTPGHPSYRFELTRRDAAAGQGAEEVRANQPTFVLQRRCRAGRADQQVVGGVPGAGDVAAQLGGHGLRGADQGDEAEGRDEQTAAGEQRGRATTEELAQREPEHPLLQAHQVEARARRRPARSPATRPSASRTMRPAVAATAGSWVATTMVSSKSARTASSRSSSDSVVAASRLPVGSSASRSARPAEQRPRQPHPLSLAAGEPARRVIQARLQPDRGQQIAGVALEPAPAAPRQSGGDHVLQGGERRKQMWVLEDQADVPGAEGGQRSFPHRVEPMAEHLHLAVGRPVEPADEIQQRALARPGGPGDRHGLTRLDDHRHLAQRPDLPGTARVDPADPGQPDPR